MALGVLRQKGGDMWSDEGVENGIGIGVVMRKNGIENVAKISIIIIDKAQNKE